MKLNITKKDWIFLGGAIAIIVAFILISGQEKTKRVPYDDLHRPFYTLFEQTKDKKETEKECGSCHNETVRPLPPNHPPKYRCLFCHKLVKPAAPRP
ncbi:MAG TPA: cytochrome C [Geobacterales bacterium]|nr:cytochrome C [Geobacterales bacterium]